MKRHPDSIRFDLIAVIRDIKDLMYKPWLSERLKEAEKLRDDLYNELENYEEQGK